MEPIGSDVAYENGKVERPNSTFGAMVRCLLYSAGLSAIFWSGALFHVVYLNKRLYHKALHQSPYKAWTRGIHHWTIFIILVPSCRHARPVSDLPRMTVIPPMESYWVMAIPYVDQTMNSEKLSTQHTIDEAHYGKTRRPPGPQILMDMGYEQQHVLPLITSPPPLSRYPLRSQHKTVTPFMCKLLPLPMNYCTSSPFIVIASIPTSDIDRNNSITVTFSTDPFVPSFPETILVSGIHPTLGLDLHYDIDRHRCQLISMDPGTPSHRLFQWKSHLWYAYVLSIDTMYIHTVAGVRLVTSEARSSKRTSL
jgi:hypothetical protein